MKLMALFFMTVCGIGYRGKYSGYNFMCMGGIIPVLGHSLDPFYWDDGLSLKLINGQVIRMGMVNYGCLIGILLTEWVLVIKGQHRIYAGGVIIFYLLVHLNFILCRLIKKIVSINYIRFDNFLLPHYTPRIYPSIAPL